jgi:hypothetical protein
MKYIHTNWLLYDPLKSKNKQKIEREEVFSDEIKYKLKLIEKAFR